jgi:site-specific DNA recombinase
VNIWGNNALQEKSKLKVYGYVRLSRDDDNEKESLNNQKGILLDYAEKNGYNIIKIFEDDNISGMTFDREGISEFRELAESGQANILLVKDLSRIGRHRIQSSIFLDEMRIYDVKVISVTENIDNFNENDDLVIGFKQIINEHYAKDISRKIKAGFKQKHKEGLVIIPPFGYIKDKNTNNIEIFDECARIVQLIFKLYIDGYGSKKIAQYLTENNYHTPSWYQGQISGKTYHAGKKWIGQDIWSDRTIQRVISNDAYIGTLRNGVATRSIIYKNKNGKGLRHDIPKEEQIIHENFYPPIIEKRIFDLAQSIKNNRKNNNVRASKNNKIHKYAGLLICENCGASYVAKRRNSKGIEYIEYVCNGYHRFGTKICTPHRVREEILDDIIFSYITRLKDVANDNLAKVDVFIKEWNSKRRDYNKKINDIKQKIYELKEEVKDYSKQLARKLITEELFIELTKESQEDIVKNEDNSKQCLIRSINMLDEIIKNKQITPAHLQMLINKINIKEDADGLHFDIFLNMPFKHHLTISESFTEQSDTCVDVYSVMTILKDFNKVA